MVLFNKLSRYCLDRAFRDKAVSSLSLTSSTASRAEMASIKRGIAGQTGGGELECHFQLRLVSTAADKEGNESLKYPKVGKINGFSILVTCRSTNKVHNTQMR